MSKHHAWRSTSGLLRCANCGLMRKWIYKNETWLPIFMDIRGTEYQDDMLPNCAGAKKVPKGYDYYCPICDKGWIKLLVTETTMLGESKCPKCRHGMIGRAKK